LLHLPKTFYPSSFSNENIISVASNRCIDNELSNFSNFGPNVDIATPAENLIIEYNNRDRNTVVSGTSFASPLVSATALILGSQMNYFDPSLIKCSILNGSTYHQVLTNWVNSSGALSISGAIEEYNVSCSDISIRRITKIDESLKIYPNPVWDYFILNSGFKVISITDLNGNTINWKNEGNKVYIDSESIGYYCIKTISPSGKIKFAKFIKI